MSCDCGEAQGWNGKSCTTQELHTIQTVPRDKWQLRNWSEKPVCNTSGHLTCGMVQPLHAVTFSGSWKFSLWLSVFLCKYRQKKCLLPGKISQEQKGENQFMWNKHMQDKQQAQWRIFKGCIWMCLLLWSKHQTASWKLKHLMKPLCAGFTLERHFRV